MAGLRFRIVAAGLAALSIAAAGGEARAQGPERRVALVVGNDAYATLPRLANAANDARAVEGRLKGLGWETILKVNAGRREMLAAVQAFGDRIGTGAVGLFYYAGHGIQVAERNFLVPVDARIESEADLGIDGIEADRVLRVMEEARNRLNIVILDACRDNPLPKRARSAARGLATVAAPRGSFVAFSAAPGQTAEDGPPGGNGVFTGALVSALDEPGLRLEDVFKRVNARVQERTGGRQVPWIQASITGDFYFRAPAAPPAAGAAAPAAAVDRDALFWQSVRDSRDAAELETYLRQFPDGTFAGLARKRIEDLRKTASLPPPAAPPPPARAVEIEPLDVEMAASGAANVRAAPDATAEQVGRLAAGEKVGVTGRVKGQEWYRVAWKGRDGFVFRPLLREAAVALPSPAPSPAPVQPAVGAYPAAPAPGTVFRDCPECPEMVVVPAGEFVMGSPASEQGRLDSEGPQRRVRIPRPFAAGKHEVTFAEWDACVAGGGCDGYRPGDQGWGRDRRPVINVSWNDAKAYVAWLKRRTGKEYRLLSEAEWEYAARGGTTTRHWCGDSDGCLGGGGWYSSNSGGGTQPVGGKGANRFGLHDVHGNVWEWVEDCWNDNYTGAPGDGSAWTTGGSCSSRVIRGGSWGNYPKSARAASRYGYSTDFRGNRIGIRVGRTF